MSGFTNPNPDATQDALGGITRIYDALQAVHAAVPLPVLQMALFDATEEFCTRSCYWRETVAWYMGPRQATVDLNPVDDTTLAAWIFRLSGGLRLRVVPPCVIVDQGDTTVARRGAALVVCKPNRLSPYSLPSLLVDNWSDALRDGATFRLLGMPNKPWSNPQIAMYHGRRFRSQIFLARETVRRSGDLPGPHFPYYARGAQGLSSRSEWRFGPTAGDDFTGFPVPADITIPLAGDEPIMDGGVF